MSKRSLRMSMLSVLLSALLFVHSVSSIPIRPETTASCSLRSVQESANLNGSADLLLARVQVQRGSCNAPVCRCSVDLGTEGGGVRELQVNYPWFAYEGAIQVLGHSPSHTLYQEVSVQLVDDFGASLFEQDLSSFLDNLTYPHYFTNGLDPAYSMSSDRTRALKQDELERNKTESNDEAFQTNNNFTDDINATIISQSRRRQRARLSRRRQALQFESQEDQERDVVLLALEQRVERNLLEWTPPNHSSAYGQSKIRRRRGLLQDSSGSEESLFVQVLEACTNFGDRARFIASNSMALTNTANNVSNVNITTGLTDNNVTELDNNRNLNIQNCLTDRYQQIASYCVGLKECERNEAERLRLDLQLREQSIYQNELLAMRNFLNLIEDSKVADLDFKAEFANALQEIVDLSNATADANKGLQSLFDEIRAGEDNLYDFAEVIKGAYMQMSDLFTKDLESQQTDLDVFRGVVSTAVLDFQQYEEAWNAFIEGVDRTINRNSLYLLRLTNKGRTMSNIWKNLLKLLRKIMDGSALKPYLTRGIQTLYQGNLDGGWTPMLFEPPSAPLDWVDDNGTRVKLYSGMYSWSTITQSAPFDGYTGGFPGGEDMLLVKKRLDLVCDLVELTFQEVNIDSFSQYLYLFGPPGCIPFESCTCFLVQTEYVSNDLPLNHRFAARQLLQNLPVLYQETQEFQSLFALPQYSLQSWAFDSETNGTGQLPTLVEYSLYPPQDGGNTRNGLGVYAVEGWELILNQTVQDPLAVQELLGAEWSCSLGAKPPDNSSSNSSSSARNPRPVERTNKNWFYDNWCLQNTTERLSAWTEASIYWLRSVDIEGEAFQNLTSLVLDNLADRCVEASGRIEDPWNYTYDNTTSLQDFFVDIVAPTPSTNFNHRFWGPGFGFDGLFGHLRAGLVRGEAPVLASFLTPEMYRAQLLVLQQPADTELRVCNGSISQLNIWDNPVLSHAWGYWRNALLVNTNLSESDIKEYLFASEELSSVRTAAALFWQTLDEIAIGFMVGLQTDLYEASLGELPVPLYHSQSRSYLQTSYGEGETPPDDKYDLPLQGGVEGDELTFKAREARMLRTETAGMLSVSPDASPLWSLRGLKARTQATIFLPGQDSGEPVRGVRLAVGSATSPPAELLVAGYWSCWDQPCPQRVTLLDKRDGRIEETASYRDPQIVPPCIVPSENATEEEVTDAILSCPFFGGRASTARPADGLFPYLLDLPQELLRSALSPSFEGRLNTPFYLFEPSDPELVVGTGGTDVDLLQGPVFRRKTRQLGDYVQLSSGRFHVKGGQRDLGQHIARLRKGLPACLDDVSGAASGATSSSCLLSMSSLEKSCVQAKSINGLCSLLTRFYPSLRRSKGEQAPEDTSMRFYPKQWTQDVTLAIPLESNKGQDPALSFPPAPFETECPEFKVSQEGDSGWRVSVLPLQEYTHDFVLSVSGCTSEAAPPPRLLTLPPPLSSASWFIGYCEGDEAAVSVSTQGLLPIVCTRLEGSAAVARPPSLSLVGSNAQALIIEGKDYLAGNIRSLGTAISNALYEGNDWDSLQAKLGEWVNTLPFVFDADEILEDLDALIERLSDEIGDLQREVADNKTKVQQNWEEYQEAYQENQEQNDNIIDLHAQLRILFEQSISALYEDIEDYKDNVQRAYEQYANSEPFFYFFGNVTEDYSAYELAFKLLAQDPPTCITDKGDLDDELSVDECPYYFVKESCTTEKGGVGVNSFLYWAASTFTLLTIYFGIGLCAGLPSATRDQSSSNFQKLKEDKPLNKAEMSYLLSRSRQKPHSRHRRKRRIKK